MLAGGFDGVINLTRLRRVWTLGSIVRQKFRLRPSIAAQIATLKTAGCEVVREEQKSGTSLDERSQLNTILDFIHPGETLVVTTRIDRLARSLRESDVPLRPIEGSVPDAAEIGSGCAFATRCDLVRDRCRCMSPSFMEIGAGHGAACFRVSA